MKGSDLMSMSARCEVTPHTIVDLYPEGGDKNQHMVPDTPSSMQMIQLYFAAASPTMFLAESPFLGLFHTLYSGKLSLVLEVMVK